MSLPKNDPSLHALAGIEALIEQAVGEKGIAIEFGLLLVGEIKRGYRELVNSAPIPLLLPEAAIRDHLCTPPTKQLWATLFVHERDVILFLEADARANLNTGQRFEIRKKTPTNFGRTHGIAWYHNDAMDGKAEWETTEAGLPGAKVA